MKKISEEEVELHFWKTSLETIFQNKTNPKSLVGQAWKMPIP